MKAKTFILASILLAAISCSEFDDTLIWEELRDHEERITNLENLCNTMNSDIKAVQSLMTALKNRDYIKSVTPIIGREDKEIGYKIVFNDSDPIIIYHGTDGKDGENAPVISIQYHDGRYYWAQTIDGITSWLYDNDGNLVPAEGQDAVTPLMKIDSDGYWIVRYNNGYTYSRLLDEDGNFVRAEGRDGNDGSDAESFFESVEATEDEVILILADGTEIIIPLGGTPLRKAVLY